MLCAELNDYNIFLISTTLGDFWRKFDITILVHPYTTSIKPYFRILHQLPLSKLCCITWGLLELSKPDLSFTYWQISSGQASICFIWDWTYQPTRFIFRSLIWALVRKGGQGRAKQQPRCTKQVHTCIVGSSYMRDPPTTYAFNARTAWTTKVWQSDNHHHIESQLCFFAISFFFCSFSFR